MNTSDAAVFTKERYLAAKEHAADLVRAMTAAQSHGEAERIRGQIPQVNADVTAALTAWLATKPDGPTDWWPGGWARDGGPGHYPAVFRTRDQADAATYIPGRVFWTPISSSVGGQAIPLDAEYWAERNEHGVYVGQR